MAAKKKTAKKKTAKKKMTKARPAEPMDTIDDAPEFAHALNAVESKSRDSRDGFSPVGGARGG